MACKPALGLLICNCRDRDVRHCHPGEVVHVLVVPLNALRPEVVVESSIASGIAASIRVAPTKHVSYRTPSNTICRTALWARLPLARRIDAAIAFIVAVWSVNDRL